MRTHLAFIPVIAAAAMLTGRAGTAAAVPPPQCPQQDGLNLSISSGELSCADAYSVAVRYDTAGEKYQTIDAFTCYTGNAMTAPVYLTCVSDSAEFFLTT